jgi:hypothetical protein
MLIRENAFRGEIPAIAPQYLPAGAAQVSHNAVHDNGNLRPLKDTAFVATPAKSGTKKAIHLFAKSFWFHWLDAVDAVRAPIPNDTQERTVFTGDGVPKVTDASIATAGGGVLYPNNSYLLGIPAPESAPSVTVIAVEGLLPKAITAVNWSTDRTVWVVIEGHGLDSTLTYYGPLHGTGITALDGKKFNFTVRDADSLYVSGLSSLRMAPITGITKANPAKVTSSGHTLLTGDTVHLTAKGMTQVHNLETTITQFSYEGVVDVNKFTLDGVNSTAYSTFTSGSFELMQRATDWSPVAITALTNANPAKVTKAAHNMITGDRIVLAIPEGTTELDEWMGQIVRIDVNNFTLQNLDGTDVNSSLYGTFTSGTYTRLARWEPEADPAEGNGLTTTAYVETFVRRWSGVDEEGPPSPASALVDVDFSNGQAVQVSQLNAAPTGGYNITHRRIYRVNTASDSALQFVAEQAIADTTYTDGSLSSALGEVLQTEDYSPPPDDLAGIRAMPNGALVGYSPSLKCACFSEPYQCHAWPTKYRQPVDYKPVGVEVFGSSVLVATEGPPAVATGALPGYMTMDRTEINQACTSRRGMADLGSAVAYPSPDGLMIIGSGVVENATKTLFRREDWQALNPSSFIAVAHNGTYYAFYDTGTVQGCLILNLADGSVDFADIYATAVHVDLLTDTLYLQRGDDIVQWEGGANLTLTRKGPRHDLPRPGCFSVAQVKATAYPCTYKLYTDGTLRHTQTVANAKPFRLPSGYRSAKIENEVLTAVGEIEDILVAETMSELRQV